MLYRLTCTAFAVGDSRVLLCGRAGEVLLLDKPIAERLLRQPTWDAAELAEFALAANGTVGRFVDSGIVQSIVVSPAAQLPFVGAVVTADRPAACARTLDLLMRDLRPDHALLMIDNSATEAGARGTLECAKAVAALHHRRVVLFTATARYRLASEIRRVDRAAGDAADTALTMGLPCATLVGTARNLLQLLTLGHRVLSLDDDTLGPILEPPAADGVIAANRMDVGDMEPLDEVDVSGWSPARLTDTHADWLGKRVGSSTDYDSVVATLSGLRGDCGAEGPWRELMPTAPRKPTRLTRRVVRGVRRPTLASPTSGLMTYAYGVLNDGQLPPFMPIGRNQDGAFAACLHVLRPEALVAHLPIYVVHAPLEPRSERRYRNVADAVWRPPRTNDLIAALIRQSPAHMRPAARMRVVCETMSTLGRRLRTGDVADLRDHYLTHCTSRLHSALRWQEGGGWFRRYQVRRTLAAGTPVFTAERVTPAEWNGRAPAGLGAYLESCATMLLHWPAVTGAMATLPRWTSPWVDLDEADGVVHVSS